MGSLRKAQKRANSKSNSAARKKRDKVHSGGRQASVSDNKSNKQNTARLQGEETFQVRNSDGSISTFKTQADQTKNQKIQDNKKFRNEVDKVHQDRVQQKEEFVSNQGKKELQQKQESKRFSGQLKQKGVTEHTGFKKGETQKLKSEKTPLEKVKFERNEPKTIPSKDDLFVKPTDSKKIPVDKSSNFENMVSADRRRIEEQNNQTRQKYFEANPNFFGDNQTNKVPTKPALQQRQQQKEFLAAAKDSGAEFITIKPEGGEARVVPIDQGFREIVANPNSTVSVVPNIPKDTAVTGLPTSSGLFLVSTKKPEEVKPKISSDIVSQTVKGLDEYDPYRPDDKVQGAVKPTTLERVKLGAAQAGSEALGTVTGMAEVFKVDRLFQSQRPKDSPQYYVPQTVPTQIISSPFAAAVDSKNIGEFENRTKSNFNAAITQAQNQPIEKTVGQGVGFVGTIFSPTKLSKLNPVKITKTPVLTKAGSENVVTTLRVGYGDSTLVVGGKNAADNFIFIGKQTPDKIKQTTVSKIEGTTGKNSFETFELADFSKRQLDDITPHIRKAEQDGTIAKGDFDLAVQKGKVENRIAKEVKFDYNKNIKPKDVETTFQGLQGDSALKLIASEQSGFRPNLFLRKGSGIINEIKGGIQTKVGDWDFTAKTVSKGEAAANRLMKTETKSGFELEKRGTNIFIKETKTGKEREFANIVTPREERISAIGELGKTGEFFGETVKTKAISQGVEGIPRIKIKSQDFKQQIIDWGRSTSGIVSKRTLDGFEGEKSNFGKLFDENNARVGFALFHRSEKDFTRSYFFGLRESAKAAWQSGNKDLAREIGFVMRDQYKQKSGVIDIKSAIKKLRAEESGFDFVKPSKGDSLQSVGKDLGNLGKVGNPVGLVDSINAKTDSTTLGKLGEIKSVKNNFSKNKSSTSVYSSKNSSVGKGSVSSTGSIGDSAFVKSLGSAASIFKSAKSTSVKSSSKTSVKSSSPKSITSQFKFIKSTLSPKPKSSKSSNSVFKSSTSPKSPSTISPKSPLGKSPKSPFATTKTVQGKVMNFKSFPDIFVRLPPLIRGNVPDRREYVPRSKSSLTFLHSTFNPFSDKFSINVGKDDSMFSKLRGKRYEI